MKALTLAVSEYMLLAINTGIWAHMRAVAISIAFQFEKHSLDRVYKSELQYCQRKRFSKEYVWIA